MGRDLVLIRITPELILPIRISGPPTPPTFPVTVLGVWRFDGDLTDDVSQNDYVTTGGSATFKQFNKFELLKNQIVTRKGLEFEADKTYSLSAFYTFATNITVAFWWFSPGLVGFTRHFTTREQEPKVAPILARGDSTTTSTQTNLNNTSFVITEIGFSKTQNAIRIYISKNGTDVSQIITSEPYTPGLHHVLFTYIHSEGRLRVDIDGKTGVLHSGPSGSIQKSGDFRLNTIVPGFLAHKTTQTGGYIFDLLFTSFAATDNESMKAMRYGYEHIAFNHLFDTRFCYFGMSYAQPATVSTTHIFVDGGNVFAARSNGEIVKGDRAIWDKEFTFPNARSVALLTTSEVDADAECTATSDEEIAKRLVQWTPGGLCVRGASVRV